MKRLKPILQLLCLAAAAFAVWHFFFPPPEKVIKKRLEKLAAAVSANPKGNIAIIANVNSIASFFHPEVNLNLEGFGRGAESVTSRQEIQQMALGARQNIGSINVQFYNITALVDDSRTNAAVRLTALVKINDQADAIVQNISMEVQKADRKWVVRSAVPIKERLEVK